MDQLSNDSACAENQLEETTQFVLNKLVSQIDHLQESHQKVSVDFKKSRIRRRLAQGQLIYFSACKILRRIIATTIDMRIGGVLIGATISAGISLGLAQSWFAFFCGFAVGAAVFTAFLYFPHDGRISTRTLDLENQLADCRKIEANYYRIGAELNKAKEKRHQILESQRYRLEKLVDRNWKAMRGGELEQFLEEVFTELGYCVDRTGGAGDQGVDLILMKDGYGTAVQVKGYLDSVPNTAIQESFTGMTYYKCNGCAVITNSRFTAGGRNIAKAVGCVLIDEETLPRLILGQIDLRQMILTAKM